jgi:hypothetical protein
VGQLYNAWQQDCEGRNSEKRDQLQQSLPLTPQIPLLRLFLTAKLADHILDRNFV